MPWRYSPILVQLCLWQRTSCATQFDRGEEFHWAWKGRSVLYECCHNTVVQSKYEERRDILLLFVMDSNQPTLESDIDRSNLTVADIRSAHCTLILHRVINLQGREDNLWMYCCETSV